MRGDGDDGLNDDTILMGGVTDIWLGEGDVWRREGGWMGIGV